MIIRNNAADRGSNPHDYCKSVLPRVSRTFSISIDVLRGDFYKSILCSYLLCRIIDTVEDSKFADFSQQKALFNSFTDLFARQDFSDSSVQNWVDAFFAAAVLRPDEQDYYGLIKNTRLVVANFLSLPRNYRDLIRECVIEMSTGMLGMVAKRENNGATPFFLTTEEDLEKYCYFVAGTVGILTTKLLREDSSRVNNSLFNYLEERSVSFGLGLQMTNILKDCWTDYQRGLCYIPKEMISRYDLMADNFFVPENSPKAQKTIDDLIEKAAAHLDRGLDLIVSLPRTQFRVKLSCLWPLFFAIKTLIAIKNNSKLLSGEKTKISRDEVKTLLRKTTLLGWNNKSVRKYYDSFRGQL
ncbi:MAG: squalene/phytoene synthase family protein [bacterium]